MASDRSEMMSRIRGSNTKPERLLRSALWRAGMRYRLHSRTPVGRPDIVMKTRRIAIFVDGCFWHGCPEHYVKPRSRTDFWAAKLRENVERDMRQTEALERDAWHVLRFWEHEVFSDLDGVVERVRRVWSGGSAITDIRWRVVAVEPLNKEGSYERRTLQTLRKPRRKRVVDQVRHTRKWEAAGRN